MSNFAIITDSCCDFTEKQYQNWNVISCALSVTYNGENHSNFSDEASVKAFYDEMRGGVMATTSAVNPEGWSAVIEPQLSQGLDVLVLAFSSGLSTTYQSAVIAADELKEKYPQRKIHVVDTLCAALGQGMLVWYACRKREEGLSVDETAAWCEENKLHLCHWFTVNDLNHLKRGGRVSAATALVGTMLNIKPVLHVDNEGHLINMSKARGRKASIEAMCKKIGELSEGWDNETIFIGHGDCAEDAAYLESLIRKAYPGIQNVITGYVGPVIGAHTGPGVLALFFMGNQR